MAVLEHEVAMIGAAPGARAWSRLQAASGIAVVGFVGLHLANTVLLALSFDAYDRAQAVLRAGYQQPVLEGLLVLAILLHIACAVRALRVRALRRRSGEPAPRHVPTTVRWRRRAGQFLLVFLLGHIVAVRGPSLLLGVYPGAAGLGFTMAFMPAYFYPYYFLLGLAGLYHGASGLQVALARFAILAPIDRALGVLTVVGALALLLALLGAGGVLYATPDPYANDFARLVLRLVGAVGGSGPAGGPRP